MESIEEEIAKLRQEWRRQSSRAVLNAAIRPQSIFASCFNAVQVCLPHEAWPLGGGRDGQEALMPLSQFNLTELPYCPESLSDLALIAVYIDPLPEIDAPNGAGWLIRAYSRIDELVPVTYPTEPSAKWNKQWNRKPIAIQWELITEDYPTSGDAADMKFTPPDHSDLSPDVQKDYHRLFPFQGGTKIGGWPRDIQGGRQMRADTSSTEEIRYVFQIDSEDEAEWYWADQGIGYFGRGSGSRKDVWELEWECC